ncbi:UNVERIFIED_CONTAM: Ni2+-binding GTPase involved in maturation of urease and hydrogenase [Acetivibrio alkalicellulosi]
MNTIIIGGGPSSGKTSMLLHIISYMTHCGLKPSVCKIDCIKSNDDLIYKSMNIPVIQGLSDSICPDHFLATNLPDIFMWSTKNSCTHLFIETAGLCNRCAPFTDKTLNICVIDSMSSIKSPEKLGPLVTTADIISMTKTDVISQAEREVLSYHLSKLNPTAEIICINGLSGFGSQTLANLIINKSNSIEDLEGSKLKYPMPSANCAYCVGEIRIGKDYQQGMINKMSF